MPMISPTAISPHNSNMSKRIVPPQPKNVESEAHEAQRAGWLVMAVAYFKQLFTKKKH